MFVLVASTFDMGSVPADCAWSIVSCWSVNHFILLLPCRYLIHNQTGLHVEYWVRAREGDIRPASKKSFLPSGKSEELKVSPVPCVIHMEAMDGMPVSQGLANVMCLQLGDRDRWLPLEDVAGMHTALQNETR